MCFFPVANFDYNGKAYKKGVYNFNCGYCPECLSSKMNTWALRAVYEARSHAHNCMITLTYDTYKYVRGMVAGENPPDPSIPLSVRDIQLFMKRLRKHFGSTDIKYLCGAERGKSTSRAHYHMILFGVDFRDRVFYKKSKRGNPIYKSATLTKLWGKGICTIDSITISPKHAKYCTKYLMKNNGCDDSFQLFSHELGLKGLLKDFNFRYYMLEGRKYPVPRIVWQKYLMAKYGLPNSGVDYRYVNRPKLYDENGVPQADDIDSIEYLRYLRSCKRRALFQYYRDNDSEYKQYLRYWKITARRVERFRPSVSTRIRLLDSQKYYFYKSAAIRALIERSGEYYVPSPDPRQKCSGAYYIHKYGSKYWFLYDWESFWKRHLPLSSRLKRASDTATLRSGEIPFEYRDKFFKIRPRIKIFDDNKKYFGRFTLQMSFDML